MQGIVSFDEETISRLFGHEAAEDENVERLKEYYFKTDIYDQISVKLPLRILVGHKGIGKSALFSVAQQEDIGKNIIVVSIKPDDILDLYSDSQDFLKIIRDWKFGLSDIICSKVLQTICPNRIDLSSKFKNSGGKLLDFLNNTFKSYFQETRIDLKPAKEKVINSFLQKNIINVYIDDLDRGWQGRKEDITRISALLNAVRDLSKDNNGLNFKVSLRSDVYYLIRTADESTDKIEGSVIWQTWTQNEILFMLVKRIETFFGRLINEEELIKREKNVSDYLDPIFERFFEGEGHWKNVPIHKVIMSLVRKRPRDLIKLCTLAARAAKKRRVTKIGTKDLESVFQEYSQGRLQDAINEYRSELPDIERLLINMRPSRKQQQAKQSYLFTTDELLKKLTNVEQTGKFVFSSGEVASLKDLAGFMYKINFLTARMDTKRVIDRKYFEENRYLSNQFTDFGYNWEIHPAYRWALQPLTTEDLFCQL